MLHSPVEEFSPIKPNTQSGIESISEEFSRSQQSNAHAKGSSYPNTQQSKVAEPPTFDRDDSEEHDSEPPSRKTTPERDRQMLKRMEEAFVDYDGGHEESFSRVAADNKEVEASLAISPEKGNFLDSAAPIHDTGKHSSLSGSHKALTPSLDEEMVNFLSEPIWSPRIDFDFAAPCPFGVCATSTPLVRRY